MSNIVLFKHAEAYLIKSTGQVPDLQEVAAGTKALFLKTAGLWDRILVFFGWYKQEFNRAAEDAFIFSIQSRGFGLTAGALFGVREALKQFELTDLFHCNRRFMNAVKDSIMNKDACFRKVSQFFQNGGKGEVPNEVFVLAAALPAFDSYLNNWEANKTAFKEIFSPEIYACMEHRERIRKIGADDTLYAARVQKALETFPNDTVLKLMREDLDTRGTETLEATGEQVPTGYSGDYDRYEDTYIPVPEGHKPYPGVEHQTANDPSALDRHKHLSSFGGDLVLKKQILSLTTQTSKIAAMSDGALVALRSAGIPASDSFRSVFSGNCKKLIFNETPGSQVDVIYEFAPYIQNTTGKCTQIPLKPISVTSVLKKTGAACVLESVTVRCHGLNDPLPSSNITVVA